MPNETFNSSRFSHTVITYGPFNMPKHFPGSFYVKVKSIISADGISEYYVINVTEVSRKQKIYIKNG
jgi:hypothetical protein